MLNNLSEESTGILCAILQVSSKSEVMPKGIKVFRKNLSVAEPGGHPGIQGPQALWFSFAYCHLVANSHNPMNLIES